MSNGLDETSLKNLQRDWEETAIEEAVKDPNTQGLFGRVNVRVNVFKALKVVYLTANLYLKGKLVLATGSHDPKELEKLGKVLFDLVMTSLDALREKLRKSTYAACVVLSGHPDGLTPAELESELKAFIADADAAKLPFYMGFTEKFLSHVRNEIAWPGAFDEILKDLRKDKWVTESDGRLFFKERHFVWGVPGFS